MKNWMKYAVLVPVAILIAGCGTTKVAVRPDATHKVHKIALIKVSEPVAYEARDWGHPGMMFGAIGAVVAADSSQNAGKDVNQIVTEAHFSAGAYFTKLLQERLSASGYQVGLIEVAREKKGKLIENYGSIDAAGADAVLDLTIESIGYATEHPMFSPFWRPASQVQVALVDSRSGEKVYVEKFMYGYHNPFMSGTNLDAPEAYRFKNKDELFANSEKLVSGIRDSVEAVVAQISADLDK